MKFKSRFFVFLFVFIIVFNILISPISVNASKVPSGTSLIFIGDSRTVGMKKIIKGEGYYVVAKVGEGYNYLNETVLNKVIKKINSSSDINKWIIVSGFGVNDLGNIKKYKSFYKSMLSKLPSGKTYTLCLTPVFQVNEKDAEEKGYTVKNSSINNFNTALSKLQDTSKGIYYLSNLDTNPTPRETIKGYLGSDGLHFSPSNNKKIYNMILSSAVACGGGFESNSGSQNSGGNSAEFKSKLEEFTGRTMSDEDVYNWSLLITSLRADGFTDTAIAGILGNIKHEGASGDYAIEGMGKKKTNDGVKYTEFELGKSYDYGETKPSLYTRKDGKTIGGEGHGLVQWSFGRCDNLTKYAEEHPEFKYVTVTHYKKTYDTEFNKHTCKIPSIAGQVCFMIQELNSDYKDCKEDINKATSPSDAAKIFHDGYEKSVGTSISARQKSAESAVDLINCCTGAIGSGNDAQNIADAMVNGGIWDESKFVDFCNLTETALVYPNRDSLDDDELKGITDWNSNLKFEKENKIISFLRKLVVIFSILLIIYIITLYLAFWFDRINNFIEFEAVKTLTGGRLATSLDDDECTFENRGRRKSGEMQTVNHRAIIKICLTGLFFAVLILTGQIYKVIEAIVNLVRHWLRI